MSQHPDPSVQRLHAAWAEIDAKYKANTEAIKADLAKIGEPTRLELAVVGLLVGGFLVPLAVVLWRWALS